MSGHSKYSTIKHHKAVQDNKRAKLFQTILKRISHEARVDSNVKSNPSLKNLVMIAKKNNIPSQTIARAIQSCSQNQSQLCECIYEGFFHGTISFIILCHSSNINRTSAELRTAIRKKGATLGGVNSCRYLFEKVFLVKISQITDSTTLSQIRADTLILYENFINNCHYFYYLLEQSKDLNAYFANHQEILISAQLSYRAIQDAVAIDEELLIKFRDLERQIRKIRDVADMWSNIALQQSEQNSLS